ncbi:hypothetical protein Rsub_12585 [Raphidocelis subcapitata]|uniref:Enkurin domain-containing protein n=1 Tax=Raphidocelis subcapitata TaxID=307507 RepID=A0A2V0PIM0_9CHLO|nr:hypothetical protein Rsub_12585 [Raphidocelis subcapitata]|eukprot:GBF99648.1 hypothetical protein Rsub_12585 [Raphidocelis subcapitata]
MPSALAEGLWEEVGRDTAAGRALFLLYGGHRAAREAGAAFSARNRSRAPPAGPWAPPPPPARPPPKPRVAVPRVGAAASAAALAAAAAAGGQAPPRRRPAAAILSQLRADADEAARDGAAPPPRGPLLDAAEKERLALLMQHRGKPPPPAPPSPGARRCPDTARPAGGELARLQARFDALRGEVEEREAWLLGLRRDGIARPEHAAVVRGEVAERAAEMRRVDARLRALEAGIAAGGGGGGGGGGGDAGGDQIP